MLLVALMSSRASLHSLITLSQRAERSWVFARCADWEASAACWAVISDVAVRRSRSARRTSSSAARASLSSLSWLASSGELEVVGGT